MNLQHLEERCPVASYRQRGHLPTDWRANGDHCAYTQCSGCGDAAYVVSAPNKYGIWVFHIHGLMHEDDRPCPSPLDKASCVFPSEPVSPEMKKLMDSPWKPT
jgi:hypothetical protein